MLRSSRSLDEEIRPTDVLVEVGPSALDHQLDPLARSCRRGDRARVNLAVHLEQRVVLDGRGRIGCRMPDEVRGQKQRPPQKLLGRGLPSGATPQPQNWNAIVRVSVSVPFASTVVPRMWTNVPPPLAALVALLKAPVSGTWIVSPFAARATLGCASGGTKLSPTWTSNDAFDVFEAAPLVSASAPTSASATASPIRLIFHLLA